MLYCMRFLLDVHLGTLARLLRLLGFDVYYRNDLEDAEIAHLAEETGRIVLSRDRELLKRKKIQHSLLIASTDPFQQLVQVLSAFELFDTMKPFSRCSACGEYLEQVTEEQVYDQLPQAVRNKYTIFYRCPACGKLFWKGDHLRTIQPLLEKIQDYRRLEKMHKL